MANKNSGTDSSSAKQKTPKLDMAEELRAINAGKKGGYTPAQRDSVASTFDKKSYEKQINDIGYKSAGKKKSN